MAGRERDAGDADARHDLLQQQPSVPARRRVAARRRPGQAKPLTLANPHESTVAGIAESDAEPGGSLLGSTAGRAAFLAVLAVLIFVLQ